MEFKELLAAFAAKYGIDGLGDADGAAELDVETNQHSKTRWTTPSE